MIARSTPTINHPAPQLHLLAVGKITQGHLDLRVAPRPANADFVLAATAWGRQLCHDGASRIACRNAHEEAGFDEAAAELEAVIDEMHSKPGLDYAPVNVNEPEAEPSWAAFLVHAAAEDDRSDAYAAGLSDFANLLPSTPEGYSNAAQQARYVSGYSDAQLGKWAEAEADDYADDIEDREWHARGSW